MSLEHPSIPRSALILCLVWCVATPNTAFASKVDKTAHSTAVQTVLDCRALTDGVRRLACFDAAVEAMETAEAKGDLVTIDREQRLEVRRQAFGLSLPAFTLFDHGEKGEDANRLTAAVADVFRNASGRWVITLEGGATWRQIDDTDLYKTPHQGSIAVLRRGALGSFFMTIDGDYAFRAHRDN